MESELDRKEGEMNRRTKIEIAVVALATLVAFAWTLSSAVALMPLVYYLASRQRQSRATAA